MKKVVTVLSVALILFLFSTRSSFAQSSMQIGGQIGLNFATLGGNDSPDGSSSRTGILLGGFFAYNFAPFFTLQPEILYSAKGASGATQGINYTFSFNYIEVPVLLKFLIPLAPGTPVNINVYAGPDFGFNIASSLNESAGGQTQDIDESNNTSGFDFNIMFGGGVGFKVGVTNLFVDLRYSLGLGSAATNAIDLKNRVFALSVGAGFPI